MAPQVLNPERANPVPFIRALNPQLSIGSLFLFASIMAAALVASKGPGRYTGVLVGGHDCPLCSVIGDPGERTMPCRGVRGATTADANTSDEILKATRQLLAMMIRQNGIRPEDVASAIFTTTPDLDAEFPALAARQLGWLNVPLLCGHELGVPGSLDGCVRILLHWNTDKSPEEIQHVYIKEAVHLRPDLSKIPPVDWDELEQWISEHLDDSAPPSRCR